MVDLDPVSDTLDTLPHGIHPWLQSVAVLGFISFIASVGLQAILTYCLIRWHIKSKRSNQFVILIFNLLWADIQQSLAFLLNVEWLRRNSVIVGSPICWTQGWMISTGDLGSGVWCFAIGLHTFASVVFNYRLRPRYFYLVIAICWVFVYGISSIPVGMYRENLFVRSGIWCWVHHDLKKIRLWTHYFWIFFFEFANVIIYAIIYTVLLQRIRSGYYTVAEAKRVKSISNLMVAYPVVYVICTLPLASARMAAMSGNPPSTKRLCLAGAMITSNGWLDVLLYTLTRRIMIFGDEPPEDDNGLDTFAVFWDRKSTRFGSKSTVEALNQGVHTSRRVHIPLPSTHASESEEDLCKDIKLVLTTQVISEPADLADVKEMEEDARHLRPVTPATRWSEDARRMRPVTPVTRWSEDSMSKDLEMARMHR